MKLKRTAFLIVLLMGFVITKAQANSNDSLPKAKDSIILGTVQVIEKDPRIDVLGKKMADYNVSLANRPGGIKMGRGYRLMVLSTADRNQAMSTRSRLLQSFPDHKVYMTFQSPYIKLKFGNFAEKSEAERYRKILDNAGIVNNNIYLVTELVEIKVEKVEIENEDE